MKKLIAATILAASIATPAFSADMAVKARPPVAVSPAYDWSGFYFGGAVGGEWGNFDVNLTAPVPATIPATRTSFGRVVGTGIAGVQKQWGAWVFGIEGTWNTNVESIDTGVVPNMGGSTLGFSSQLRDLWTIGGRIGYAGWNNWLVYAQGGYAHAAISDSFYVVATGAPADIAASAKTQTDGWFAGAGVDYLAYKGTIADIIVGAEYQHIGLAEKFFPSPTGTADNRIYGTDGIDIARARLTIKFNPFGPATAVVAKY